MDYKVVRLDFPIESCHSIGGILLGSNIYEYDFQLYSVYEKVFSIPGIEDKLVFYIDDVLEVVTSKEGEIVAIACCEGYRGKYQDKIYPGQMFEEIKSLSERQLLINGSIVLDNDYGMALDLPAPFDELDNINVVPPTFKIKSIRVADFSFWKTPVRSKKQ